MLETKGARGERIDEEKSDTKGFDLEHEEV